MCVYVCVCARRELSDFTCTGQAHVCVYVCVIVCVCVCVCVCSELSDFSGIEQAQVFMCVYLCVW